MVPLESRLTVSLSYLMNEPYPVNRGDLVSFVSRMPPEGQDWWLEWSKGAIARKKAQSELAYRLQRQLPDFPHAHIIRMLQSFSEEGIQEWIDTFPEPEFALAVIPNADYGHFTPENSEPKEVFQNLFREIQWVHQKVTPALYGLEGYNQFNSTVRTVAYEECPFEEIGILNGRPFRPERGDYIPQSPTFALPFDYSKVTSGLALTDFSDSFSCYLFHSNFTEQRNDYPDSSVALITAQSPEFSTMQQLRMQLYDHLNRPSTYDNCYTIVGDLTSVAESQMIGTQNFTLKHHPDKPLFFRDLRK